MLARVDGMRGCGVEGGRGEGGWWVGGSVRGCWGVDVGWYVDWRVWWKLESK